MRWAYLVPWAGALALYYRTLGRRQQLRRLENEEPIRSSPKVRPPWETVIRAVQIAARATPGRNTCLVRSFAAARILRHYGHPAHVVIGVPRKRIGTPGWEAHAWVEVPGREARKSRHEEIVRLRP